jgi:hypothetical protein
MQMMMMLPFQIVKCGFVALVTAAAAADLIQMVVIVGNCVVECVDWAQGLKMVQLGMDPVAG